MNQYNAFSDSLASMGLTDYRIITSANKNKFVSYIATSEMFVFRGHGAVTYIEVTGGGLNISMLAAYPSTYLSECKLVLYGACSTGSGRENAENMVNATYACGAQTVIGFEKKIYNDEFTIWVDAFFDALRQGKTYDQACILATKYTEDHWTGELRTDSYYIAGEKHIGYTN